MRNKIAHFSIMRWCKNSSLVNFGFVILFIFCGGGVKAQDSTKYNADHFGKVERLAVTTSHKIEGLERKIKSETEKNLKKIYRQEKKLRRKILAIDSAAAQTIFSYDPSKQMNMILNRIKYTDSSRQLIYLGGTYMPYLDSLQGILKFPELTGPEFSNVKGVIKQVNGIQQKLADADALEQVVLQRKEQIKRYLLTKATLPRSLKRSYGEYAKQVATYKQELTGIKETLNDPDKLLRRALVVANKTAVFKQFMQRNSFLAQFFPVGSGATINSSTGQAATGLLSRNQFIQNVSNNTGVGTLEQIVQQAASNNSGQAMPDFSQMIPGKDETVSLPEYAPNTERSKSFKERLEYGTNFQTQRGTTYFPVTSDIAFSVGYKLSQKGIMGVGASYKLGLGENIQNIRLTNQGLGLRSFIDYKLKGKLFITGGLEYNYQQPTVGLNVVTLPNGWTASGLLGLTRVIEMNTKVFKRTKIQVLWDFFGKQQLPQRQQLLFRVGYNF